MILRIDADWILGVQYSGTPTDPALRDWGALQAAVERHKFERFAGEAYYDEAPTRAAVLLHTIVRLAPFEDCNGLIGAMCAWEYMEQSGSPISPPPGAMSQLVRDIRSEKAGLQQVARSLSDWAA
ncbi:Fic family protein [Streptomyces sp. NPDC086549]|uniref:Fic family protein n=1 Tax=Streptomyces sp. NPDC086549 TaxID=3365752 RepID=UPI0037F5D90B